MLTNGLINFLGANFGIDPYNLSRALDSDVALTPRKVSIYNRERQSANKPRQTDAVGNQEMANKINELYNELNQKDKDLKEARESVRRLQGSVREFRRRAEDTELNASRDKTIYTGLAASYNKQVEINKGLRAELNTLYKKVDYLLAKLNSKQDVTADDASPKLTVNDETDEISKAPDNEVDAIDNPLDAAEEIFRRIRGL